MNFVSFSFLIFLGQNVLIHTSPKIDQGVKCPNTLILHTTAKYKASARLHDYETQETKKLYNTQIFLQNI